MSNQECLRDLSGGKEIGNVIFLDIDGVLNNRRSMKFGEHMDIECARNLRRICKYADAEIVVSSTWRIGNTTHTLREILYPWGLYRVIGRTSSNNPNCKIRGDEVQEWIDTYGCKNYLILDDDSDFTQYQKENHFINTDAEYGLTEEQSTYAIRNIFKVSTPFCPECNGYGRIGYEYCGTCNGKILRL